MPKIAEFIIVLVVSFSVCLTLMALFFFILINKYRRNLEKKQKEAINNLIIGQDNERQRLARDLHDEIGPQLSSIVMMIGSIKTDNSENTELVADIRNTVKASLQDVRRISHDLMSQALVKYGLVEGVNEMVQRRRDSHLKINFQTNSTGMEYSDHIKSHLFKITQELLYNTDKHSKATEVSIILTLNHTSQSLVYIYKDNGIGNPMFNDAEAGIGLKNIKTRVSLMNGTIEIDMKSGFTAIIELNY
ncbi:MAG TPA: histidine kinase [Bacteroidia bacterium]